VFFANAEKYFKTGNGINQQAFITVIDDLDYLKARD